MNAVNSAEHHRASTFYVDSKGGCDENDGRSEAAPFKTLERVSRESYGPGDRIRFRRGRTYCGSLTLNACGHVAAPVRVEAYGSGTAPKIAGQGGAAVTIRAVYLTLEGLEITNPGGLFGIHILPLKSGENSGIPFPAVIFTMSMRKKPPDGAAISAAAALLPGPMERSLCGSGNWCCRTTLSATHPGWGLRSPIPGAGATAAPVTSGTSTSTTTTAGIPT